MSCGTFFSSGSVLLAPPTSSCWAYHLVFITANSFCRRRQHNIPPQRFRQTYTSSDTYFEGNAYDLEVIAKIKSRIQTFQEASFISSKLMFHLRKDSDLDSRCLEVCLLFSFNVDIMSTSRSFSFSQSFLTILPNLPNLLVDDVPWIIPCFVLFFCYLKRSA